MPGFEAWDIVRVPFPYRRGSVVQHRPVLVLAALAPAGAAPLLWVLMITSAAHPGWPGDVAIGVGGDTGLSAESVVRTAKIATMEQAVAGKVGVVSDRAMRQRILAEVETVLRRAVVAA